MKKNSYNTTQKQLIYNFLKKNASGQFSAKEIFDNVKTDSKIGESTVYRLIKSLTDDGVVRRFNGKNTKTIVYQFAGKCEDCHSHFHLKCEKCNKIIHLNCDVLKDFENHLGNKHGFLIDPVKTIFYGTCEKCKGDTEYDTL